MAVVAIVAALSGLPALAGVGGQGSPSRLASSTAHLEGVGGQGAPSLLSPLKSLFNALAIEGVGGAIDHVLDAIREFARVAPEKARGVGGQGGKGVGGQG
jgi:hypothetical protein